MQPFGSGREGGRGGEREGGEKGGGMRKSYISRGWVTFLEAGFLEAGFSRLGGGIRNRNISRVLGQLSPQAQGGPGW